MPDYTPSPADREISLEATLGAIVAIALVAQVLELAGFERATLVVLGLGALVSAGLATWHLARFRRFHREQVS
jgi:pimeloyl-ACP methyl ester carboxylesterase